MEARKRLKSHLKAVKNNPNLALNDDYFVAALELVRQIDYQRRKLGKFDGVQLCEFSFRKMVASH